MPHQGKRVCKTLLSFLLVFTSACVGISEMYRGRFVAPAHVVPFNEQGPHEGVWKTFDITISYEYVQRAEILEIKGRVFLGDPYQNVYPWLGYLDTYLIFLDPDSLVLDIVGLASGFNSRTDVFWRFSRELKVPPGTASLSFGYRGEVCEENLCIPFHLMPQ